MHSVLRLISPSSPPIPLSGGSQSERQDGWFLFLWTSGLVPISYRYHLQGKIPSLYALYLSFIIWTCSINLRCYFLIRSWEGVAHLGCDLKHPICYMNRLIALSLPSAVTPRQSSSTTEWNKRPYWSPHSDRCFLLLSMVVWFSSWRNLDLYWEASVWQLCAFWGASIVLCLLRSIYSTYALCTLSLVLKFSFLEFRKARVVFDLFSSESDPDASKRLCIQAT